MAQWLGQSSGHTHATRVEDAEAALRHAVEVYRTASLDENGARKAIAVRNLAERLLSARLKLFKARLAALPPIAEGKEQQSGGTESLKEREAQTRAQGISGILVEFGAQDALALSWESPKRLLLQCPGCPFDGLQTEAWHGTGIELRQTYEIPSSREQL